MNTGWLGAGLFFLFLSGLVACTPLHTEVRSGVDWTAMTTATLQPPQRDPWGLEPVAREELRRMGLSLATAEGAPPDLLVRYALQTGPDVNAEGIRGERLTGLHLQFLDPDGSTLLAVADYFPRSAETPADAMRAAFAGLRKRLQASGAQVDPPGDTASAAGNASEIHSRQSSPWLPRLESWGIEDWGKTRKLPEQGVQ